MTFPSLIIDMCTTRTYGEGDTSKVLERGYILEARLEALDFCFHLL